MLITDISRHTIILKGKLYMPDQILQRKHIPEIDNKQNEYEEQIFGFLKEWFNGSDSITVQTSGSTGKPKKITVKKSRMIASAVMTCEYLNLQKGNKILLCLPVHYIAGCMMLVRALVAELDIYPVAPCGNPLSGINMGFKMAPLIPMQVYNSLQDVEETEKLKNIEIVIVGGAAIDASLEEMIKLLPNKFYSTYGMTETLSHIALRQINGNNASSFYEPLKGVGISLSDDKALIIEAPHICKNALLTNDIAKIHSDGNFEIIGRKDNVINSGGIKLFAEQIEQKISGVLSLPYAITSLPDPRFGEIVVLVLISKTKLHETEFLKLRNSLTTPLSPYEMPKKIVTIPTLPLTSTGKIDRKSLKKKIVQLSDR